MARAIDATVGDGVLLVDKPAGWSSHAVVGACRRIAGTRKVGHAGTLDPMATGLLLVGVNTATRLLTFLVGCDKTYTATIRLGASTVTDDAEGEVTELAGAGLVAALATPVGAARVDAAVESFIGTIEQIPSAVSAIKVGGERAYTRVRQGEDVRLAARPVTIRRFEVLRRAVVQVGAQRPPAESGPGAGVGGVSPGADVEVLDLDIAVDVSSGTYVRALARDLGAALGVGGHLTALRRTRIGGFDVGRAHTIEALESARAAGTPREHGVAGVTEGTSGLPLVPMGDVAASVMPVRTLTREESRLAVHGVRIASERPGRAGPVAALDEQGRLVAVLDESGPRVRLLSVLAR